MAAASADALKPVSYTHLDVYKRQMLGETLAKLRDETDDTELVQAIEVVSRLLLPFAQSSVCLLYTSRCV